MHYDLSVLRALVRIARRRSFGSLDALVLRAGGSFDDARAAFARLARAGLAERTERGLRPTLAGLAVAVASARAHRPVAARRPRAVAPRVVRRRAAA